MKNLGIEFEHEKGFGNMISTDENQLWKRYSPFLSHAHVKIVCRQSRQDQKNHPIQKTLL